MAARAPAGNAAPGAQPAAPAPHFRPDIELGIIVSKDSPVGSLGAEAQVGIAPWLAVAVGTGFGFDDLASTAQQYAGTVRVRDQTGAVTLFAGMGVAEGPHVYGKDSLFCYDNCSTQQTIGTWWMTTEAGVQIQTPHAFLRASLVAKLPSNGSQCSGLDGCGEILTSVALGAGVRF
ncbi:MAG: hypothetical protein K8W52_34260 [Deltaproteobacteria bacterium]|nr:hypothetical protein [Deltaproteobacteria bacterium]